MTKVPITVSISYAVLRDWLKLPDDVDLLGIPGANDIGGSFSIIVETPVHHIKGARLTAQYRKDDEGVHFAGFV